MGLIDANALLKDIERVRDMVKCDDKIDFAIRAAKAAPTIDADVRHGRWDGDHRCTAYGKICVTLISKAGRKTYVETPFCPNCGAKMLWIPTPREA